MFKDTDRELARLEAELLKEAPEDSCEPDDYYESDDDSCDPDEISMEPEAVEEAPPEYFYEDTRAAQGPAVYQNYSNAYGKNLRNYASGYRAYNSDVCDEDLDAFSEEVLEGAPRRRNTGLVIAACVLAAAIAVVSLLFLLWYRGVI